MVSVFVFGSKWGWWASGGGGGAAAAAVEDGDVENDTIWSELRLRLRYGMSRHRFGSALVLGKTEYLFVGFTKTSFPLFSFSSVVFNGVVDFGGPARRTVGCRARYCGE